MYSPYVMGYEERDFDAEAADWDLNESRVAVADSTAACLLQELDLGCDSCVLDYGCGTGLVTLRLAEQVGSIVAADSSPRMLEQLQSKLSRLPICNVRPRLWDVEAEGPPAERFGCIVCTQTLSHLHDAKAVLRAFRHMATDATVLALGEMEVSSVSGGRLPSYGTPSGSLAKLLERCGWEPAEKLEHLVQSAGLDSDSGILKHYYIMTAQLRR